MIQIAHVSCYVLIATRDRWDLLRNRALPSIRSQSRLPDTVVLINDGKPFSDFQNIEMKSILHPIPLKVSANHRKKGAAGAWNSGLEYIYEYAPECFIAMLDDDDEWEPCHLAVNESAAIKQSAHISISGLRLINNGVERPRSLIDQVEWRVFLSGNPGWQGSNTFAVCSLFVEVGGFREELQSLNDRDLAIRMLRRPGVRVAFTNEWTSKWHLCSDRTQLSSPGSLSKLSGLRIFWAIYGKEMNAEDENAFFARAEKKFRISRRDILNLLTHVPQHLNMRGDFIADRTEKFQ